MFSLGVVVLSATPPARKAALDPYGHYDADGGLTNRAKGRTGLTDGQAEKLKPCDWKGWAPGHVCSPSALCESRWHYAKAGLPGSKAHLRGDACLQSPSPSLLFVHIGKTCGGTVDAALHANAGLIEKRYPGRPAHATVHAHAVSLKVLQGCGNNVVISIRDPIDRLVSAFNTLACKQDELDDPDVCERRPPTKTRFRRTNPPKSLLSCFANVTVFAEALDDDDDCGEMARRSTRTILSPIPEPWTLGPGPAPHRPLALRITGLCPPCTTPGAPQLEYQAVDAAHEPDQRARQLGRLRLSRGHVGGA